MNVNATILVRPLATRKRPGRVPSYCGPGKTALGVSRQLVGHDKSPSTCEQEKLQPAAQVQPQHPGRQDVDEPQWEIKDTPRLAAFGPLLHGRFIHSDTWSH